MTDLWLGVGALAGFAVGLLGGVRAGRRLRPRPSWQYWSANGVVLMLGVAMAAIGAVTGQRALSWAGLAFATGGLSGLKYGLGRVVGQFRDGQDGPGA